MACVSLSSLGCVITKHDKQQQIGLTRPEWRALVAIAEPVSAFMAGRNIQAARFWVLPHDGDREDRVRIRVTLNPYEGARFVDIRLYVDDKPSKQGVTLNGTNWASVQTALGTSAEAYLAKRTYAAMLKCLMKEKMATACEGCAGNWSSQRDHACMMNPELRTRALSELPPMNEQTFIVELAVAAKREGIRLERPHECYQLCHHFLHEDIKSELLSSCVETVGKVTPPAVHTPPPSHPLVKEAVVSDYTPPQLTSTRSFAHYP